MSQAHIQGLVVILGGVVQSYDDLHRSGLQLQTREHEYHQGIHGINGLIYQAYDKLLSDLIKDSGVYKVALITTPVLPAGSLSAEPEVCLFLSIENDDGKFVDVAYHSGFTQVDWSGDIQVKGKASIGLYSTNVNIPAVNAEEILKLKVSGQTSLPPLSAFDSPISPFQVPRAPTPMSASLLAPMYSQRQIDNASDLAYEKGVKQGREEQARSQPDLKAIRAQEFANGIAEGRRLEKTSRREQVPVINASTEQISKAYEQGYREASLTKCSGGKAQPAPEKPSVIKSMFSHF